MLQLSAWGEIVHRATQCLLHLVFALVLTGCDSGIHDGPMKQMEGRQLDEAFVQSLVRQKATKAQVVASLGPPSSSAMSPVDETITYTSIRERESYRTVFGIRHSETRQRLIEVWTLTLRDGALVESKYSSRVE